MSSVDSMICNRAGLAGDVRLLNRTSISMMAILDCLRDGDISDFRREGLLQALDGIAGSLSARAGFIDEEILGNEGDFE